MRLILKPDAVITATFALLLSKGKYSSSTVLSGRVGDAPTFFEAIG